MSEAIAKGASLPPVPATNLKFDFNSRAYILFTSAWHVHAGLVLPLASRGHWKLAARPSQAPSWCACLEQSSASLPLAAAPAHVAGGSTGRPKGVMIAHGALRDLLNCERDVYSFTREDVSILTHSGASCAWAPASRRAACRQLQWQPAIPRCCLN